MMFNCELTFVRQTRHGLYVYTCAACGLSHTSLHSSPAMISRMCLTAAIAGEQIQQVQKDIAAMPPVREKCGYLGTVQDYVPCPTCKRGGVHVAVYSCGIHGRCSLGNTGDGTVQCPCPDYVAVSAMPGAACEPSLPQVGPGLAVLIPAAALGGGDVSPTHGPATGQ